MSSRALDERERAGEGHALAERLEGGALDGGPVGERIAERDADLEDVGHLVRGAQRREAGLGRRVARGEVRDERRASLGPERGPGRREPGLRQSNRQP